MYTYKSRQTDRQTYRQRQRQIGFSSLLIFNQLQKKRELSALNMYTFFGQYNDHVHRFTLYWVM